MIKVIQTNNPEKVKLFADETEAQDFIKRQRKAKGFYMMVKEAEPEVKTEAKKSKADKVNWKDTIDFTDAVNINRDNVRHYHHKSGYIKVTDSAGNVKHIGKTINMGKVFSNYVNCARYNQSYDYNESAGDKLYFKEADLNS